MAMVNPPDMKSNFNYWIRVEKTGQVFEVECKYNQGSGYPGKSYTAFDFYHHNLEIGCKTILGTKHNFNIFADMDKNDNQHYFYVHYMIGKKVKKSRIYVSDSEISGRGFIYSH